MKTKIKKFLKKTIFNGNKQIFKENIKKILKQRIY